MIVSGFDWDAGNRAKIARHGLSVEFVEYVMGGPLHVAPDPRHYGTERRFRAVAIAPDRRGVFIVFTLRQRDGGQLVRPISARYMHKKELKRYEKALP
jgi:uncharacterized DUF497 family protein